MQRQDLQRLIAQARARQEAEERVRNIGMDGAAQKTGGNAPAFSVFQAVYIAIFALGALGFVHAGTTAHVSRVNSPQVSVIDSFNIKSIYGDLASSFNLSVNGKNSVPVMVTADGQQKELSAELITAGETNHLVVAPGSVTLDFQNIKQKPEQVSIYVTPTANNKDIRTNVVYVGPGVSFEQTAVTLQKKFTDKVNAVLTCADGDYDVTTGECSKPWQLSDARPFDHGTSVTFTTKHFSAVAGAYLNIIDKVNDETVGITWKEHFQTYGASDLTIKTVDGTHFGTDLGFQGIFCGDSEVAAQHPDADTYTISNYSCDGQVSSIHNMEQTSGIHWMAFTFGGTADEKVHNFACDSGTLATTCTVSTTQTMNNGDTISGAGALTIANAGNITSAAGNSFTINMTGAVLIQDGGQISGNVTITAASLTLDPNVSNGGGKIVVDSKGGAGSTNNSINGTGTGGGVSGNLYGGSGAGYGGTGGTSGRNGGAGNAGGITYGSVTQPASLGSGGGACFGAGGAGGGAIKITTTGTLTVNGSISANGAGAPTISQSLTCGAGGGGSGGSIWLTADTIAGSGSITANGGAGGADTQTDPAGSGGGGGRIALYYTTAYTQSGTLSAFGGGQGTESSATLTGAPGGAGTIYKKSASATNGDLIVNNNSVSTTSTQAIGTTTQISASSLTFDNVTSSNSGKYVVPSGATLNIAAGLSATGAGNAFTNNGTISLAGTINLTNFSSFTMGTVSSYNITALTIPSAISLTVTGPANLGNVTMTGVLTLSGTSTVNMTGLTMQSGATLTHAANTTTQANVIDIAVSGNVDLQSGSSVSVNGLGYKGATDGSGAAGSGPGGGPAITGNFNAAGGGSYGGNGSANTSGTKSATAGSVTQPSILGSGGGDSLTMGGNTPGAGGGMIKIIATGSFAANGVIQASGSGAAGYEGAGSGGSIWLAGDTISGTGSIAAVGGAGTNGGGGGGGRIAFYYTTAFTHSGTESVAGGSSSALTGGGAGTIYKKQASAANGDLIVNNSAGGTTTQLASTSLTFDNVTIKGGSSYVVPSGDTLSVATAFTSGSGSLTINSGATLATAAAVTSLSGAPSITLSGTYTPSATSLTVPISFTNAGTITGSANLNLTISSGGTWSQQTLNTFTLSNLTVQSGGTLTHAANTTTKTSVIDISVSGNIDIQTGGAVNVDSDGYSAAIDSSGAAGNGPGGGIAATGVNQTAGGGCYGGQGGQSTSTGVLCSTYGSASQPVDLGSGGGDSTSYNGTRGAGGGAVKLTALSGTVSINGTISANGGASANHEGSGSGGSIWVTAANISGTGAVTANGGGGAGAGGGGRVSLMYTTSKTHSGSETASGGSGTSVGTAGTVLAEAAPAAPAITAFCSASGNGCTVAGTSASPQQAYRVNNIAGTATAGTGGTIGAVNISIKDTDVSVNKWYNTSNNSFDQSAENFFAATGTTSWSYNSSAITWTVGHTYQVRAETVSANNLISSIASLSFTYNTSPPTIANVTAVQSGNNVNVTYDVSDPVFNTFTVSLGFDAGITLIGDITSGATSLVVSDASKLPASGSLYIDDEEISYSSKASNTLNGLTRARTSTTAAAHTNGTIVYLKATTLSGAAGASVAAGTGKSITWTAATDIAYASSTAKVKVIANNLNSTNQVGSALSSNFVFDTTLPATQQSTSVRALPTSDTAVTISWTTDKASSSTVDYGTTTSYGLTTTVATLVTSHAVNLTGLTPNTLYYFRIKSIDANNNILIDDNSGQGYSVTTPNIIPGRTVTTEPDITPPVITEVSVSAITSSAVTVSWTTDEIANSFVYYGSTTSYGNLSGAPDVFVTAHQVSISGLTASTTYNYQVVSLDKSGNRTGTANATFTTTAADGTGGGTGTGTGTGTTGSADLNVDLQNQLNNLQNLQASQEQLIAQLQQQLDGAIDSAQAQVIKQQLSDLREKLIATNGKIQLLQQQLQEYNGLKDENTKLKADNQKLADQISFITNKILGITDSDKISPSDLLKILVARFQSLVSTIKSTTSVAEQQSLDSTIGDANTTLKDLTNLVPGPRISVKPTVELGPNNATIAWTTDKPASSQVAYADQDSFSGGKYSATAGDASESVTEHKVVLQDLLPATTYHYQISSVADSGATTTSQDFTFATKTALAVISNAKITKLDDTSAQVSWTTSIPANSAVIYAEVVNGVADTANSKTTGSPEFTTQHSIKIDSLLQGRVYTISVTSADAANNVVTQQLGNFATGEDKTAPEITELRPQISIIPDAKQSTIQAIITWKTNEPASTQVIFGKGSVTGDKFPDQTAINAELTYSHTAVITNWDPGELYSFKAVSKDQSGNEALSKTYTVHTPQQKGTVVDVIIGNFTDVFGWTKKLNK